MASLRELMGEVFPEQVKTASAASKPSSTAEVDRVLNDLGLLDAESVKTASASTPENNGGPMSSLAEIYERTMSTPVTEKTAAAAPAAAAAATEAEKTAAAAEDETGISDFGSLVGGYFNDQFAPYVEKVAADLETEAGKGHKPQADAPGGGGMTSVIGKEGDPALAMNHAASDGAHLKVTTQGHTPYSLAVQQSVLKRFKGQGIVGEQK